MRNNAFPHRLAGVEGLAQASDSNASHCLTNEKGTVPPLSGRGRLSNRITPEIDRALRRALLSSVKILGVIPRAAQGIEAASAAETVQHGSVHESPVPSGDAPK